MKRKLAILIAAFLSTQAAFAGGSYIGKVKLVHYGTLYLDASATQMSNRPACATRTYGTGTCTSEGDELIFVVSYP